MEIEKPFRSHLAASKSEARGTDLRAGERWPSALGRQAAAKEPTVDPHDRTPNTQARVIETRIRRRIIRMKLSLCAGSR
jgi:hypothetical protein